MSCIEIISESCIASIQGGSLDGRPNFESHAFPKLLAHEPKKYMVENQFMYEEEAFPNYPFLYTKSL